MKVKYDKIPLPVDKDENTLSVIADIHRNGTVWDVSKTEYNPKTKKDETTVYDSIQSIEFNTLGRNDYKVVCKPDGYLYVVRFADLHRHSDSSLLDGISRVPDIIKKTEYAGAITDHGNMYSFLTFYKGMKAEGKKPIIGFEAYVENMDCKLCRNHLILLAKNNTGYKNLLHLTSESFEHFYGKPHVTWEMLQKYHEGIICCSACIAGVVPELLGKDLDDKAKEAMKMYIDIFGEDYYVEIQRHHFPEETYIMNKLLNLAREMDVKVIATVDSHYTNESNATAHEIALALQTQKTMSSPDRWTFNGDGYYIHSSEDMETLFADLPEALDNTLEIADKCNVEIKLKENHMPKFEIPAPFANTREYFEFICNEGFKTRFMSKPQFSDKTYRDRFYYEVNMIETMGFEGYFLIVWDYCNWARQNDIYVGPGRGSAAGSLAAYCMGITDLDPIQYELLFERFLNPERVSMPDIDVDFEHNRRNDVLEYCRKKYGGENVCHIVTFGTECAKVSLKDVARVLDQPASFGMEISKLVPSGTKIKFKDCLANPDFKNAYDNNPKIKEVVDFAMILEGCKRHSSQHACGMVLSDRPIVEYLPASMEIDEETGEKALTSQVEGPEVEELGLLKMDFLGLKNMTAIHDTLKNIVVTRGITMDYHDIPLNDRKTYEMLRDGHTGGVFQLESSGMTAVVQRMLADLDDIPDNKLDECFERMIACVALYRPGPMDFIDDYIVGMRDPSTVIYDCPEEQEILESTYGVIVYQEQVMKIVQKLAGYSLARADLIRKAMGKKKQAILDAEKPVFIFGNQDAFDSGKDNVLIPGCVHNGISQATAELVWDKIIAFAKYAFNRSHAACYAYIAIITAYMRCYWAPEFYAAMCNAFINEDKLREYLVQSTKEGIEILPPDINLSQNGFTSTDGKTIRFGIGGLKGVKNSAKFIIENRDAMGPYKDICDLYNRLNFAGHKLNSKSLDALTWSRALQSFGYNCNSLDNAWNSIVKAGDIFKTKEESGQFSQIGRAHV